MPGQIFPMASLAARMGHVRALEKAARRQSRVETNIGFERAAPQAAAPAFDRLVFDRQLFGITPKMLADARKQGERDRRAFFRRWKRNKQARVMAAARAFIRAITEANASIAATERCGGRLRETGEWLPGTDERGRALIIGRNRENGRIRSLYLRRTRGLFLLT